MLAQEFPYPGIRFWRTEAGVAICRLHYSADPTKDAEWARKEKQKFTDPSMAEQELEINFSARSGQLVYVLHDEATLCNSRPLHPNATRYFSLDPHPRVPHAFLWCAVEPDGTRVYYRELWPSKICGMPGNPPDDDNRFNVKEYLETIKWLESKDNPENDGKDERIFKRVIDYAARGMGQGTTDDPEMPNMQQRYESKASEVGIDMLFEDAKKDLGVGIETVNLGLKPLPAMNAQGDGFVEKSKIQIFQDKCPELVWELRNNRWKSLTPVQAETNDPSSKVIEKRKHMTDNLRYIEMANPEYVAPVKAKSSWRPITKGINF